MVHNPCSFFWHLHTQTFNLFQCSERMGLPRILISNTVNVTGSLIEFDFDQTSKYYWHYSEIHIHYKKCTLRIGHDNRFLDPLLKSMKKDPWRGNLQKILAISQLSKKNKKSSTSNGDIVFIILSNNLKKNNLETYWL